MIEGGSDVGEPVRHVAQAVAAGAWMAEAGGEGTEGTGGGPPLLLQVRLH